LINEETTNFLEREIDKLERDFLVRIKQYLQGGIRNIDLARLQVELDLFQELQEAGLSDVIDKLKAEYIGIVEQIADKAEQKGISVVGLKINDLEVIMNARADELLGKANAYALQYKSELLQGLASGASDDEIVSTLQTFVPLKTNQLIASVNTAREQFHAATVIKMFEDEPDIRYKLNHVLDDRTRCQCRAVAMFQLKEGYTKTEIEKGAWTKIAKEHCPKFNGDYGLINRGGFNCRGVINIL
jgi:hypothetical protein